MFVSTQKTEESSSTAAEAYDLASKIKLYCTTSITTYNTSGKMYVIFLGFLM